MELFLHFNVEKHPALIIIKTIAVIHNCGSWIITFACISYFEDFFLGLYKKQSSTVLSNAITFKNLYSNGFENVTQSVIFNNLFFIL